MTPTPDVVRMSSLIGAEIYRDDVLIGKVGEVLLDRQSGVPSPRHDYVVSALVCSNRGYGTTLGYDRREQNGPWILARIVRHMHRNDQLIPWTDVLTIRLRGLPTGAPTRIDVSR